MCPELQINNARCCHHMPSIYKGCQKAKLPSSSVTTAKSNAYVDRSLSDKLYGWMCFTGYKRFLKHTRCVLSLQVFKTQYTPSSSWIYLLCFSLILSYVGPTIYHAVFLPSSLKRFQFNSLLPSHHCIFLIIPLDSCNPFLKSWNTGICKWQSTFTCDVVMIFSL